MKLFYTKKNTKTVNNFTPKAGKIITKITEVKKYFLGIPLKTTQKNKETFLGEVKYYDDCHLFI